MTVADLKVVSGNATQAVANDDFEGYVREANKADLEAKFGTAKVDEPPPKHEEPPKKAEEKPPVKKGFGSLSPREMRAKLRELDAENERLRAAGAKPAEKVEEVVEPKKEEPAKLRARPKADDKNEKNEPKYKDWTEYEDDLLAWNEEKLLAKIDERDSKKREEAQVEAANRTIERSWNERVEKSREAHEDYDEVALDEKNGPGKMIGPGSIVDRWILESEHGAELLYLFGKNPEKLRQFEKVVGGAAGAYRLLAKLEDEIVAAQKKEKPLVEEKPELRVTKTPKPASEVGGRGNRLPDPVAAAVADGSDDAVGRYIAEQNRREIRERFGDRGR